MRNEEVDPQTFSLRFTLVVLSVGMATFFFILAFMFPMNCNNPDDASVSPTIELGAVDSSWIHCRSSRSSHSSAALGGVPRRWDADAEGAATGIGTRLQRETMALTFARFSPVSLNVSQKNVLDISAQHDTSLIVRIVQPTLRPAASR